MQNLGMEVALDPDDLPQPNILPTEVLAKRLGIPVERAAELLSRYADDLDSVMRHVAAIV